MDSLYPALIIFFAFAADSILGDPVYRFHPVRLMGSFILSFSEKIENHIPKGRKKGVILALSLIIISAGVYLSVHFFFLQIHIALSLIWDLYVCWSFLACKDLITHTTPVRAGLEARDLESARSAVSMIVGRDVNFLDERGVIRASIETLFENFVDGVLSPVFWYAFGCIGGMLAGISPLLTGLCLMILFKSASTLDSMVGYKTEKFKDMGWAGARLDDVMNFFPARLSVIFLSAGALLLGLNPLNGIRTFMRDRLKHESPNSAHSESFGAGVLQIRLGGPTRYRDGIRKKPWLGGEFFDPELFHLDKAVWLIRISAWIAVILCALLLWSIF
jgi:adenosylcobinamide-phosphate synthase